MYSLAINLEHLTKLDARQVKQHGNAISSVFKGVSSLSMLLLQKVFPNKEHLVFFYFNYERYCILCLKIEDVDHNLAKLTIRAKKNKRKIGNKKTITHKKNALKSNGRL
ncbi:hypothetical protein D5E79_08530 [Vibrio parahaemolyticus]|nr:hypothetical protein D5E79_08530 [Vibrio parahaemolyticus]